MFQFQFILESEKLYWMCLIVFMFSLILPRTDSVSPFSLEDSSPVTVTMEFKVVPTQLPLPAFIFYVNSTVFFACIPNS